MQLIRILTLPILPIYALIVWIRNTAYDLGIMKSNKFDIPVIGIGNLSVGGTGKTPATEYIIRLLKNDYNVGVISRGYLRKTKGYLEVLSDMKAWQTGDEPLQMKRKFGDAVKVGVDRQRIHGITNILTDHDGIDVIVLDDAYQHRSVKPGINILLTTWDEPYFKDRIIPIGDLREFRAGKKRADIILVTKCPDSILDADRRTYENALNASENQLVAFASIKYGTFRNSSNNQTVDVSRALVVTGIANPDPMLKELERRGVEFEHLAFKDHHDFSKNDIEKISNIFDSFAAEWILTTEKDSVRLLKWLPNLKSRNIPVCYLEMEHALIHNKMAFEQRITEYVRENKDNHRIP